MDQAMDLEIWDARSASDFARWDELYRTWPGREAFAHPAYVALFAEERDRPLAAFARLPNGFVLFPFILREIPEEVYGPEARGLRDITSPYGYGGPFASGEGTAAFAEPFFRAFDRWAASERVVSEFVRFALFDDRLLPYPGERERKLWNVVRSLEPTEDELFREFEHKVRKNVNKARRSDVTIEVDVTGARLVDFLHIYAGTMDRREARASFYFPRSFFETIASRMQGSFAYFHALRAGQVISTELALVSDENVYSFLGGTEEAAFEFRPNDLLKFELILWAKRMGKKRFVLGGGYAPDDGIFRYKRSFAPEGVVPFYVGKRVLDPPAYERLTAARTGAGRAIDPSFAPDGGFFPAYRAPLPRPASAAGG